MLARRIAGGVATLVFLGFFAGLLIVAGMMSSLAGGDEGDGSSLECKSSEMGKQEIPGFLMPIYRGAAAETDSDRVDGPPTNKPLGPRGVWILAAMNSIESGFGQNMGPSDITGDGVGDANGAHGWMQFIPSTWAAYGVDADGDGRKDPYDPDDAIYAAAKLLRANGAPENWYRAIHLYNPGAMNEETGVSWYADDVIALANQYQGTCEWSSVKDLDIGELDFDDTSGEWAGSMKFAKALASLGKPFGCIPTSEKRETMNTADGGISDHYIGAKNAYAIDIGGAECSLDYPGGGADRTAYAIAKALNFPVSGGELMYSGSCIDQIRGAYRFQLIWHTSCGGNHYNHVHIGVRLYVTE